MYDYRDAVKEDVRNYIKDNVDEDTDRDELVSALNDDLFACDSITSNASDSYSFSKDKTATTSLTTSTYWERRVVNSEGRRDGQPLVPE